MIIKKLLMKPFILILKVLKPDLRKESLKEVKAEELRTLGVKLVLVDADNTLNYDRTTDILPYSEQWVRDMENAGFQVILFSNAKECRASITAGKLDIPFVGMAKKPFPFRFLKTCLSHKVKPRETVMIGDQMFTDVLGGNLAFLKTIYVKPYEKETDPFLLFLFKIKRRLEPIIFRLQDKYLEADNEY